MHTTTFPPLELSQITKSLGGRPILLGVDLVVRTREIHALLGPNGAGKTTLTKIASGLLNPDEGSVRIAGEELRRDRRHASERLGLVLGGDGGFYGRASALENLRFFAHLSGVPTRASRERALECLRAVHLLDSADAPARTFSRGMTQRLHLARALLTRPAVLLLDEVTSGLDPEIALEIRQLILELRDGGAAVLLTSHLLTEVEQLADRISLLSGGRIMVSGTLGDIMDHARTRHVTSWSADIIDDEARARLRASSPGRLHVRAREGRMHAWIGWPSEPDERALISALGARPLDLVSRPATLEEAYLDLVRSFDGREADDA